MDIVALWILWHYGYCGTMDIVGLWILWDSSCQRPEASQGKVVVVEMVNGLVN